MVVKGNQPQLFDALQQWFEQPPTVRGLDFRQAQQVNKAHGRLEVCTLQASTDLNTYLDWPGLQQALRLERQVTHLKTGQFSLEIRYAVTSLAPQQADAPALLALWRSHWSIENDLHWQRDVHFHEDASTVRTGHAPAILASIRNAILGLLHLLDLPSVVQAREHFAARPFHAFDLLELPVCARLE